ncbi:MAG: PEGA domain-containing protein [Myxococcota bacterium]
MQRRVTMFEKGIVAATIAAFVGAMPMSALAAAPAPPVPMAPPVSKKVALFVLPKTKAAAGDAKVLQSVMRTDLGRLVGIRPVSGSGEPPMSLAQLLVPQIETGFRALDKNDGATANDAFEKAYKDVTQFRGPADRRLLARVLKGLGASRIMVGKGTEGDEALDACLNVWPNQQLNEYSWTADLRSAFNDVQSRKAGAQTGSLEVEVDPEGAAIRIDGELKGFAPVTVSGLAPGRHWVEAQLDGYRWSGMFVEVPTDGGSAIHALELEATAAQQVFETQVKALEKGVGKGQVSGAMADLQRTLGADIIIVLSVGTNGQTYAFDGWQRETGDPQRVQNNITDDDKFATNVRAWLASLVRTQPMADDSELPLDSPPQVDISDDIIIDPNDPIFRSAGKKHEESVTGKWWFWAVVGGVTAGLVGGGYALLSGTNQGSGPSGNIVLQVNRLP